MDPELAKLLTVLLSSALAVGGTLLGASIGARAAARVAQINVNAQREIARDADRRKRKAEHASHLLDLANGRIRLYRQFHYDALVGRSEDYPKRAMAVGSDHGWDASPWMMTAGPRVRDAIKAFVHADNACHQEVLSIGQTLNRGGDPKPYTDQLLEKIGELGNVLVFLNQTVEDYIDGHTDTPEEREMERAVAELIRRKTLRE